MRKMSYLKLLASFAAMSWVGMLVAGHGEIGSIREFAQEKKDVTTGTVSISKKDVDLTLDGMVRQEWLGYDKIYTLRASNDDQLSGFRSKSCIDFATSYGKQKFGKSAVDAFVRLTNYGVWQQEGIYTPFTNDDHERNSSSLSMLTYMEEMWVNIHFGTFFDAYDNWFSLKEHPISLKVGYFPYQLGRGITFGDFPMHIPYLGWPSYEADDTRYNHPGILVHGEVNKNISYEMYYSKQREESESRNHTWKTVHQYRTDDRRQWRGIAKDRDLWAAKLDMSHSKDWGDIHVQPYGMYIDAPETHIEWEADSNARIGTVGMMADYKKGRFSMNVEVAGQFGHQNMFAVDRNRQETYLAADGTEMQRHTHVFGDVNANTPGYSENKSPVNGTTTIANVNIFANRGGCCPTTKVCVPAVTKNGDRLNDGAASPTNLTAGAPGTTPGDAGTALAEVYNSNVTGNARFRAPYRIDYRGFMAVADMKYEFEEVPVTIMGAAGYISGDKYPYNEECDKRYKAFIPYGDYNYVGKFVKSQVIMDARKLPRPVDISFNHQYAFNNVKDLSNLAYIGTGVEWRPFEDKKKLMLQSNIIWFWEATTLKKWDKEGKLPTYYDGESTQKLFKGEKSWHTCCEGIWDKQIKDARGATNPYNVGWMSEKDASRMLGTEVNFEVQYRPVENSLLLAQLGFFLPGQLYKDLDGQPNYNTINGPKAAEGVFGLGHDPVWRLTMAFAYKF